MPHPGHCRVVPYFWSGPFTPRRPGLGHSRVVWLGPFTPRPRVVWLGPFSGSLVGAIYITASGGLVGAIYTTASGGLVGAILGWSGWGHSRVVWLGPFTPRRPVWGHLHHGLGWSGWGHLHQGGLVGAIYTTVVWLEPFTPRWSGWGYSRVVWLGLFSGGLAGDTDLTDLIYQHSHCGLCLAVEPFNSESRFNGSLIVREKVTRQCPQTQLVKREESRSGIEPRSFCLPLSHST